MKYSWNLNQQEAGRRPTQPDHNAAQRQARLWLLGQETSWLSAAGATVGSALSHCAWPLEQEEEVLALGRALALVFGLFLALRAFAFVFAFFLALKAFAFVFAFIIARIRAPSTPRRARG